MRTRPDHERLHGASGHGSEQEGRVAPLARGCSGPAAARALGVTGEAQPVASERRVETPDLQGAFPRLSEEQIESLAVGGTRRATRPGEILYREGDDTCDFLVILDGLVAVVEGLGSRRAGGRRARTRPLPRRAQPAHRPGRLLLGGRARGRRGAGGAGGAPPRDRRARTRRWATSSCARSWCAAPACSGSARACASSGSRYSPDTRRLREFAARNRLPHRWIDLEQRPGGRGAAARARASPPRRRRW